MIDLFIQELKNRYLDDDDNLSLIEMSEENNILTLTFKLQNDFYEDDKFQVWKIECQEFIQRSIHGDYFNSFDLLKEHVLLWDYTQATCQLYFNGITENVSGLIGELYLEHLSITEGWIPLSKYLNDMIDIRELIEGKHGLLAEGPRNIIEDYSEVLNRFNINTSVISNVNVQYWDGFQWIKGPAPYCILIFGCSFVIAKEFREERII